MEKQSFRLLRESESSWWYRGRALIIRRAIEHYLTFRGGDVLDVGAGFGGLFDTLQHFGKVTGVEPDATAREVCGIKSYKKVVATIPDATDHKYSLIGMFDVLEHTSDDRDVLLKLHTLLVPNGVLVITVPAYQWLWSDHDLAHHHFRRYTRTSLGNALSETGYRIEYLGYWNTIFFIPACIIRLLGLTGKSALGLPRFLDKILFFLIAIESLLIPRLQLPFGLSVIVIAKPDHGDAS